MDVFMFLSYWLFLPELWVIAGIILICLEIVDGSLIFFLPLGLGSILNALILFLQENESMVDYQIISFSILFGESQALLTFALVFPPL